MPNRSHNILVGFTAILGLASLAIILLLFGYVPSLLYSGYTLNAHLDNSMGVNAATRIQLYGIDIGKVEQIQLATFPDRGVKLTLHINHGVQIPVGTRISINSPLFGGIASILLETPTPPSDLAQVKFLPMDGTGQLAPSDRADGVQTQIAKDLRNSLIAVTNNLQAELSSRLDSYQKTIDKIDAMTTQWTTLANNLNQLTTPRTPQQVDAGKAAGNVSSIIVRLDDRAKELHESIASINQWTQDKKLREDIQVTAANARGLTEKADQAIDKLNASTAKISEQADKVATRVIYAADQLSATLGAVNKTIEDIRQGKGTAGKLINDPSLYNNLNDVAIRIGKAAEEFRLMVEKWRKEGLPVKL